MFCVVVCQAPNNVIGYAVSGEGDAAEYFYVHPTDGHITLLKSVLDTDRQLYRVLLTRRSLLCVYWLTSTRDSSHVSCGYVFNN